MPKKKRTLIIESKENEAEISTPLRRSSRLSKAEAIGPISSAIKEVKKVQETRSPTRKKKRSIEVKEESLSKAPQKVQYKVENNDQREESDIEFNNATSDEDVYVASENESDNVSVISDPIDNYKEKSVKKRTNKSLKVTKKSMNDEEVTNKQRPGLRKLAKSSNLFTAAPSNFRMTLDHFEKSVENQEPTTSEQKPKMISILLPEIKMELTSTPKLSRSPFEDSGIDMKPSSSSANQTSSSNFSKKSMSGMLSSDDGGSGSEDDWDEMEAIHEVVAREAAIQVDIAGPSKTEETDEGKYEKYIRQEIARRRRERFENSHKAHLLCYIAHLRYWIQFIEENGTKILPSLDEFLPADLLFTVDTITPKLMEKLVKWIYTKFSQSEIAAHAFEEAPEAQSISHATNKEATEIIRFSQMFSSRTFQTDRDLALLCLALLRAMKLNVRLLISFNPMPRVEENGKTANSEKSTSSAKPKEEKPKAKRIVTKTASKKKAKNDGSEFEEESTDEEIYEEKNRKGKKQKKAPKVEDLKDVASARKALKTRKEVIENAAAKAYIKGTRNYWIEYWDESEDRWICLDVMFNTVDMPKSIEKSASEPMLYVLGMDNHLHLRDLTARYASKFLTKTFRSLRTDEAWWKETLILKLFTGNMKKCVRDSIEDLEIRRYLESLPLPAMIADFKNHPLYVLEKDLLKFEAIYPPDIKPIAEFRGHKVFPRSAVHVLQGDLNWIRQARTVKKGEKPYKVVKARPKLAIPKEKRVPLTLDVYGFWQTEPYIPPEVVDGKIPRNEHGNVYMYQPQMVPKDCVHLNLPGIFYIARKLDIEAVQAVTGWEFHGARNVPQIEGCVILKKDEKVLRDAWNEMQQRKRERESKKVEERVWKNWRRLIKGKLLLEKMRSRFVK